ncbi:glycoside hydrolase family 19 protein [Jidongwangia harbinensis]|uniref:glycoside hydrolase family 19 protein n=1 Tax=Jidongwangia harbinensis TaxID=2878561 RepID=UPI001CD94D45|nr:glycoside hydrolase family 19 protein [Jidongwangia harbinensis]MCA2211835.1 transglycosylase SLT domain-containing protein [Jidongwangia harbinensis]
MSKLRAAAGAARGAKQANQAARDRNPMQIAMVVVGAIGFFPAMALALICLLGMMLLTNGSAGSPAGIDPSGNLVSGDPGDLVNNLMGGDGKGYLAHDEVAEQKVAYAIEDAAKECDLITPAVLAAQIEVESGFDATKVGPDGREGISQLPPEVFQKHGKDDDENGKVSALDVEDSIFAQSRHLCALSKDVKALRDGGKIVGDLLTLTLFAYNIGLDALEELGGMPLPAIGTYPYQVRSVMAKYATDKPPPPRSSSSASPSASSSGPQPGSATLSEAQFEQMFPGRHSLYTYAGLTEAMTKFPGFGTTGDESTRKREIAAFLGNVAQESGKLQYVEEIDQSVWGNYCDPAQSYGCPAGQTAYHGRGPIQLSWNYNYKAAGDALGIDLLNEPDKVMTDSSVAWQTAFWFWMTQTGAGTMTPHDAITTGAGFGETIRSINGGLECNGAGAEKVQKRVGFYREFTGVLAVEPGDKLTC